MKSILYIISGFDYSKHNGVMNRCLSFMRCFTSHGYKVTVLALPFIKCFPKAIKAKSAMPSDARWMILPHYYSYKPSVFSIYTFVEKILIFILSIIERPSFILADGSSSCNMASFSTSFFPLIANFRADESDEYLFLNHIPAETEESRRIKSLCVCAANKSSYSICVSKNLESYLLSLGARFANNYIFPCCADHSRFKDVLPNNSKNIIVGYFGGTSSWQCIKQVIELVISLRKISDRYKLLLLCSGSLHEFQNELESLGGDNYTVKFLSTSEMPAAIASMDISVSFRSNRNLNIVSSPTKLSESLAAGVPLIVSKFCGDYRDILTEGLNGVVTDGITPTDKEIIMIDSFCRKVKSNRLFYFDVCRNSVKNRTQALYSDAFIKLIES